MTSNVIQEEEVDVCLQMPSAFLMKRCVHEAQDKKILNYCTWRMTNGIRAKPARSVVICQKNPEGLILMLLRGYIACMHMQLKF